MGWNYIGVTKSIQPRQTQTPFYSSQTMMTHWPKDILSCNKSLKIFVPPFVSKLSKALFLHLVNTLSCSMMCWCFVWVEGWWPGGIIIIWASYGDNPVWPQHQYCDKTSPLTWHNIVPAWSLDTGYSLSLVFFHATFLHDVRNYWDKSVKVLFSHY